MKTRGQPLLHDLTSPTSHDVVLDNDASNVGMSDDELSDTHSEEERRFLERLPRPPLEYNPMQHLVLAPFSKEL